jgi:hypothetical protein
MSAYAMNTRIAESKLEKYLKMNNFSFIEVNYEIKYDVHFSSSYSPFEFKNRRAADDTIDLICSNFFSVDSLPDDNWEYGIGVGIEEVSAAKLYFPTPIRIGVGIEEVSADKLYFLMREKKKEPVYKGARRGPILPKKEYIIVLREYYNLNYYLLNSDKKEEIKNSNLSFNNIINEYVKSIEKFKIPDISSLDKLIEQFLNTTKI